MEKIKSRKEAAARLKQKEDEINQHLGALQDEVKQTRQEVVAYVKDNPWIGIAGTTLAGVLVGLIIGKKSRKAIHKELVNAYVDRLEEIARKSGASDDEVGVILRDALRDTMPSIVYSVPERSSKSLGSKLLGIASDMAIGYVSKIITSYIDQQIGVEGSDAPVRESSDN